MSLIPNAIVRKVARQALITQKNAPTILFGSGVIGVIGSTVLACRATLKLETVLATAQNDLKVARELEHEDYSERDRKKDIAIVYSRSAVKVGKLYLPAVLLGGAATGCLTKSHTMLNQRNVALTAAYAAIDEAFKEYRARVREKYGDEQDDEFRYSSEIVETIDNRGEVKTSLKVAPWAGNSMYARFFDEYSPNWSKEHEYNKVFLISQQNYANDMLRARGHVFLNEVYDSLGLERSPAGAVVGWVLTNDGSTDNFTDFGVFDNKERVRDFVNGREGAILLDFNVDGVIWDRIPDSKKGSVKWQS